MNGDRFREIKAWLEVERDEAVNQKDYDRSFRFRLAIKHLNIALSHVTQYLEEDIL